MPDKVFMVVVCGHNYSNAVFSNQKSAELYAAHLNSHGHLRDPRGMWVVVDATYCEAWYGE